jgi:hypothetical protein
VIIESALDYEDKRKKEYQTFQLASRLPSKTESMDMKSLNRWLDKKMILLTKNVDSHNWEFPNVEWHEGESLRHVSYLSCLLGIR